MVTTSPNAGQILKVSAKSHGIDVDKFNNHKIVSGRDVSHWIRRKYLRVRGLAVPRQKPAAKIRTHLRQKIDQGDMDVGVCIAPKVHEKMKEPLVSELTIPHASPLQHIHEI
jgi:hypothetical protein